MTGALAGMDQQLLQRAAAILREARRVVALTGAGASRESGVPTFRDAMEGLWEQYDPMDLATPTAFRANPRLVWEWYEWRRVLVREARPNPGHLALAEIERRVPDFMLVTQNVDDLHEQAGSQRIIHLHGQIARSKCLNDCQGSPTLVDVAALRGPQQVPPRCPHCGALVRPDVVWFNENLPVDAITEAMAAARNCDVMLIIGTSGLVSPASRLPAMASQFNARLIEINPEETMISPLATLRLAGPSGAILPQIVALMAS
jgi:NAD-dependent deacetylase